MLDRTAAEDSQLETLSCDDPQLLTDKTVLSCHKLQALVYASHSLLHSEEWRLSAELTAAGGWRVVRRRLEEGCARAVFSARVINGNIGMWAWLLQVVETSLQQLHEL